MIVTEEEAKTKRCQEGYAASPGAAVNPMTDYVHQSFLVPSTQINMGVSGAAMMATTAAPITAPTMCLGSACMAWRWVDGEADQGGQCIAVGGYCGKAGKP